ncbi:MoaD/ThiS family protein [Micromonospora thermarum]|uniref:MoaD/ThiS family protein n=1 Tax=Micromonospora thermarum TaxID=2720024 RepID=A0ABX0Z9H4_9ACTN|nr:MoaD/ThiS family protein [Micromonospora thermarum]NJP33629.1 MoaD/ThiS family protein [Micromonospora thermarum]
MAVHVTVPTVFRQYTSGDKQVTADGTTLADVLSDLAARHPGLHSRLVTDDGRLRRFVNLYVNDVDVRESGLLDTRTNDGDVLVILPAVAGGAG